MTTTRAPGAVPEPAVPEPAEPDLLRTVTSFDRLLRLLRRLTTPDGLSLTAASTLYRLEEFGAQRVSDLAVAEGMTQPGMTQLVSRLERDGLAERRGDQADRRVVTVAITPAGRDLVLRRRRARAERLSQLLGSLRAEERAAIELSLRVLERLAEPPPTRTTTAPVSPATIPASAQSPTATGPWPSPAATAPATTANPATTNPTMANPGR